MENTYRAVNIALIDEWGIFAENIGVDLHEVIEAVRARQNTQTFVNRALALVVTVTKDPLFGQISNETFLKKKILSFRLQPLL